MNDVILITQNRNTPTSASCRENNGVKFLVSLFHIWGKKLGAAPTAADALRLIYMLRMFGRSSGGLGFKRGKLKPCNSCLFGNEQSINLASALLK